jgi:malonyl-CoA reductase / 3-hydroxypropionate dehydrogenase (NADP+)
MSTTENGAAMRDRTGRLAGKVALITGAGGNFGETIVRRYLEEGATVVMVGRNRGSSRTRSSACRRRSGAPPARR